MPRANCSFEGLKEKSDYVALLTPEAFGAMLSAIEWRPAMKNAPANCVIFLTDAKFFDLINSGVDVEVVKDVVRAIQMSTCFEGMDKRSVLGKIVKAHPEIQSFITHGDKDKEEKKSVDSSLIVSWDSLERKKNDLEELMQKRIPANLKEIEIAREYGDLRENAHLRPPRSNRRCSWPCRRSGKATLIARAASTTPTPIPARPTWARA